MTIIWVALGGACGAALRYLTVNLVARSFGLVFPYGTLAVNVFGSFVMGCFMAWLMSRYEMPEAVKLFFATGLLGAYTTFSTFSLDVWGLFERAAYTQIALYISVSVIGSIGALFLGMALMQQMVSSQ